MRIYPRIMIAKSCCLPPPSLAITWVTEDCRLESAQRCRSGSRLCSASGHSGHPVPAVRSEGCPTLFLLKILTHSASKSCRTSSSRAHTGRQQHAPAPAGSGLNPIVFMHLGDRGSKQTLTEPSPLMTMSLSLLPDARENAGRSAALSGSGCHKRRRTRSLWPAIFGGS